MSQRRPQFILLSNMYVWTCAYQTLYLILQLMERVVNQHWLPLPIRSDTMRLLSCAMKNQVARGKRFIPYPVKRKALYWYSNRDFFSPPIHHRKEYCDTEKLLKPFTRLTTHTMHFTWSQSRDVTSWKSYPGPCSSFQAKVCRSWLRLPHSSLSSLAMTNSQKRQFHNHPGQPSLCLIGITA